MEVIYKHQPIYWHTFTLSLLRKSVASMTTASFNELAKAFSELLETALQLLAFFENLKSFLVQEIITPNPITGRRETKYLTAKHTAGCWNVERTAAAR